MTAKNELKWGPSSLYEGDAWTTVDSSFQAENNGKAYVVSRTRRRHYVDEAEFFWEGDFNLSIYQEKFDGFQHIATAPSLSSLSDLYDAAEANLAYNHNALGDLLA
ncbi:MAG TPA: hypothetical protein VF680_08065 [Allosphingosinicella sp.]